MTIKLNQKAVDHAKELIRKGQTAKDERDDWSEHAPSADEENAYLDKHGWQAFGEWYLGVDTDMDEETKGHYKFPYGDFDQVHRCGLLAAESRAGQRKYVDIELAVAHLHGMIDALHTAGHVNR
jgi:hypothetical protein